MSVQHLLYNTGSSHGALLKTALVQLSMGFNGLNDLKGAMQLMIDGDGTSSTHFDYMRDRFGFVDSATAKAAWEELNSVLSKLNTNDSVSSVNAALLQVFNKFR